MYFCTKILIYTYIKEKIIERIIEKCEEILILRKTFNSNIPRVGTFLKNNSLPLFFIKSYSLPIGKRILLSFLKKYRVAKISNALIFF